MLRAAFPDASNSAEKDQDQHDDEDEAEAAREAIPVIVVAPVWQGADEEEYEQDDEDCAEHSGLLMLLSVSSRL
ncbi:hypothetical protein ASF69_05315 [Rhizobium sp. Leaf311]|nr:hypothetical protein ASF69_05315 [Rhizobium sp. Leaf311]